MENNLEIYMNSGYNNKRGRKKTLILDVNDLNSEFHLGSGGDFNIQLFEPLIIDKHSEIYLDNFITFNSNICDNIQTSAFLLRINEFNMNTNVASSTNNSEIYGSLIIPNEHKNASNNHQCIVQKGKKFNYVCDINPGKISSITGRITDLAGASMFHGSNRGPNVTYSLTGISQNLSGIVPAQTSFNRIVIGAQTIIQAAQNENFSFLATHLTDASTLHFSASDITDVSPFVSNAGDIQFLDGNNLVVGISNLSADATQPENPDLHLVRNPGRFIAEFSIVSRE